jgi:energy-coupling factor transport system substrate-specific component
MITAGWVGQSAALIKLVFKRPLGKPLEIFILAFFGAFWGMLYGVIMNLWFWPFLAASPDLVWTQSANLTENLQRYSAYYLATSLIWDLTRSIGNVLVITFMAKPVIKIFDRFSHKLTFEHIQRTNP